MPWKQSLNHIMRNIDITIEIAQDRDKWKAITSGRRNWPCVLAEENPL